MKQLGDFTSLTLLSPLFHDQTFWSPSTWPTSRLETGVQYISWSQGRSTSRSPLRRPWQSAGAFFLSSLSTSPPTLYITPEQSVVSSYLLYLLPPEFRPWHNQKNEVRNPQSTGQHEEVLWLSKNSGSSIQTWQQSLPGRIGHPDYVLFAETLASMAWPLCSGKTDRTYGLLLKTATPDEATPPSVQRSEAYSSSRRHDYRTKSGGPPTVHSHRWRSRVESKRDTWQSLALEKIPVPHQVEGIWLQTQFLGVHCQSLHSKTDSRVLSQIPRGSETHPTCRVWQHLSLQVHCSKT